MDLKKANTLFREKKYKDAIYLYKKIQCEKPALKSICSFNILQAEKFINLASLKKNEQPNPDLHLTEQERISRSSSVISGDIKKLAEPNAAHSATGDFDAEWYLKRYADVAAAGKDAFEHYTFHGRKEGRFANEYAEIKSGFDAEWYSTAYPDFLSSGLDALTHYLKVGRAKGYSPSREANATKNPFRRFGEPEYGAPPHPAFLLDQNTVPHAEINFSVGVHCHVYYIEMVDEICTYLVNIPIDFHLFVSVSEGQASIADVERVISTKVSPKHISIRITPNKGRDIAPFVVEFGQDLSKFDLILHLHTKKTTHNPAYAGWRRYLLHYTLGNKNIVSQILNEFHKDTRLGAVFPPYYPVLRAQPDWGLNKDAADALAAHLNVGPLKDECPDFPAGSFFWARADAIRPLLEGNISLDHFQEESGQKDRTTAHAIERLIGAIPLARQYKTIMRYVDVAFNLRNYYPADRAYDGFEHNRTQDILNYRAIVKRRRHPAKIALVTAIIGNFDALIIPETLEENVDYICFSNCNVDGYGLYKVVNPQYTHPDARRIARYVKTNLPSLLPQYDFIVWIDANLLFKGRVNDFVQKLVDSDSDIGLIAHPIRSSYLEEAKEVIRLKLDDAALIESQLERYRTVPNIVRDQLIETNFMVINRCADNIEKLFNIWWSEIQTYSKRDQLSINFALHESGVRSYWILEKYESARDSKHFAMFSHGLTQRSGGQIYPWYTANPAPESSSSQAAGHVLLMHEKLDELDDIGALFSSSQDARVKVCDAWNSMPHPDSKNIVHHKNYNIEDLTHNFLANGVSIENWIPSRWSDKAWDTSIYLNKLHSATIFGGLIARTSPGYHENGQLFITARSGILDSAFGVWNGENMLPKNLLEPQKFGWKLLKQAAPNKLIGDYILLGNMQPHFGHTILEGLTRAWVSQIHAEFQDNFKYIVYEPELKGYQYELLSMLGILRTSIVHAPREGATVERLWVPDPAMRSHRWISFLQRFVWSAIAEQVPSLPPFRRIYLSRKKIKERILKNENELETLLESFGFEIICPESLSLKDQIKIAKEAKILAGAVGSQMYLGAFQLAGGKKLIFAPSNFYAKDDLLIAQAKGCSCNVVFGSKIDNFADRENRNWHIDLSLVKRRLLETLPT